VNLGVEIIIVRAGGLDLCNQTFGAFVFHYSLMVQILLVRRLEERRIVDLLFDGCVHRQSATNPLCKILLAVRGARFLELLEIALDLPMIGLE
jgi:hypothetical protein